MKKIFYRIFFIIVLMFIGVNVYAYSNTIDIDFGNDYNIFWTSNTAHLTGYNRIEVDSNGILNIKLTKPFNSYYYCKLKIVIIDENDNVVWLSDGTAQLNNNSKEYEYNVGLKTGVYYVGISLDNYINSGQQYVYTLYSFNFEKNNNIEIEKNDTIGETNLLNINSSYQGYFGNERTDIESYDRYKFYTLQDKKYIISFCNYANLYDNSLLEIKDSSDYSILTGYYSRYSTNGSEFSDFEELSFADKCMSYSFRAKKSGYISINLYNYDNSKYVEQFPYTISIFKKVDISSYSEKIKVENNDSFDYTGKEIKPDVRVYQGKTLLKENIDYYVSYKNNINVGTGTLTITGNGKFYGSIKKDFNIVDKNATMFYDVKKNDWFYDAVEYVYSNKIIKGYANGNFGPKDNITRAMFVTILHRLDKEIKVQNTTKFSDIAENAWYKNAVDWGEKNKIIYGYPNGNFGPNDKIKRQDFIVILYRFAKYKKKDLSATADISNYSDYSSISDYAVESIKWAVTKKILKGTADRRINPKGYITRAEAAVIIQRYMLNIGN